MQPATAWPAASTHSSFSAYAVVTRAQYLNSSGGVKRVKYENPFNIDSGKLTPTTKGNGLTLPGNSAFFNFRLYADSGLKRSIGSASLICSFNFNSHATCNAYYEINGSTLVATGPVDFSTLQSTLAITGGTRKYAGVGGQVSSSSLGSRAAAKNESRFDFEVVR